MRPHRSTLAAALALAAAAVTGSSASDLTGSRARAQGAEPPNILIIMTDDQRGDAQSLAVMPKTRRIFGEQGLSFRHAVTTTSLCCPSRASIFSGKYMHNHNVRRNRDGATYDAVDSVQHELGEAGFLRAFSGKYMNYFTEDPPFWDRWAAQISLQDKGYKNTKFNVDGRRETSGYATTFIGAKAIDFMQSFEQKDDVPWLLVVAPYAPHKPAIPQPKYRNAPLPRWKKSPSFFERGRELRDKPAVIRTQETSVRAVRKIRKNQLRSLMSVDDVVGRVFRKINALGERNTLAFFMSDNGFLWYEHALEGKRHPYAESVNIPLFMRWPGHVGRGRTADRLVANIDVAPTVYEATGVQPSYIVDGKSLLQSFQRDRILIEYRTDEVAQHAQAYSGFVTPGSKYVEYDSGFREFYGTDDPWELENRFHNGDPDDDPPNAMEMSALLQLYKRCAGASCP